jgi:hypothetical protein
MGTYSAISEEWITLSSQILGSAGEKLMEVADMYTTNVRSCHARLMTKSKSDIMHTHGLAAATFLVKFGDIPTAQSQQTKWEGIDVEVKAIGAETPLFVVCVSWPFLELEVGLERVCQVWGVDWANAASWTTNQTKHTLAYTYTDEEGCCVRQFEQSSVQVIYAFSYIAILIEHEHSADLLLNCHCFAFYDFEGGGTSAFCFPASPSCELCGGCRMVPTCRLCSCAG